MQAAGSDGRRRSTRVAKSDGLHPSSVLASSRNGLQSTSDGLHIYIYMHGILEALAMILDW